MNLLPRCIGSIVVLVLGASLAAADDLHAGYRKSTLSYKIGDAERSRPLFLWYPTATEARRYDYRFQIGQVAPDAEVLNRKNPVILFSHGFLGAGDQTIFLMEALARKGYIVAAVNHADSLAQPRAKPPAIPNFIDAKTWDDSKYRDRKEDMIALLDYLCEQNRKLGSFLHGRIDEKAVGAAGHSLGGYTVLGLAGGWESWREPRVQAVLALSPFATPYITRDSVGAIKTPIMLQGGTLDFGITPFLPTVYNRLRVPKYYLVLKNETHFGWTNLISLGKTTVDCVKDGNAQLMTDYSIAFFDVHLRGFKDDNLLQSKNARLESYQFRVK